MSQSMLRWTVDVKNMRLIFFDTLLNPSFKMTTSFANIASTIASTSKFIYQERFQILGIESFYEK